MQKDDVVPASHVTHSVTVVNRMTFEWKKFSVILIVYFLVWKEFKRNKKKVSLFLWKEALLGLWVFEQGQHDWWRIQEFTFRFYNFHLFCSEDLELLRHFGVWVFWILNIQWCVQNVTYCRNVYPQRMYNSGEIRLSVTSLSELASAQYLWQPKSLPISSEQTCQTMKQENLPWHCIHVNKNGLLRRTERKEDRTGKAKSAVAFENGEA